MLYLYRNTNFFDRSSKRRDLGDQSREGNNGDEPEKIREEKSSIESLSEMPDDVIAESLKTFKKCRKTNEGDFRLGKINSGTAD